MLVQALQNAVIADFFVFSFAYISVFYFSLLFYLVEAAHTFYFLCWRKVFCFLRVQVGMCICMYEISLRLRCFSATVAAVCTRVSIFVFVTCKGRDLVMFEFIN